MTTKRILCPIDFSTHSDAALAYASTLAKEASATLLLVCLSLPTQGQDQSSQHSEGLRENRPGRGEEAWGRG